MTDTSDDMKREALSYHERPKPGKLEITPTKPLATQHDLSLAYSPGVAHACDAIVDDPLRASDLTSRANLVGVVTNGSAVLGLGNIGPLAAKPVMEGKAVLFKKFAGIDVFDIEIEQNDLERFIDTVAALEPTFGGINLEDIKAPECFEVERRLRERMNIPVFHDDQHGTAIITTAAVISALMVVGKSIEDVRLVTSGAGAAALACLNQLVNAGLPRDNIIITDRHGVVFAGRDHVSEWKSAYASSTDSRTLAEAIKGADIFLGLSTAGILKPEMVASMADRPIIMALANPTPEIMPEEVKAVREDALICTGRSDYPNQVNNVLCFPYIFRGALDVGATTINEEMKLACVNALSSLAQKEVSDEVISAYGEPPRTFGPEYLIPKPFDPRLVIELSQAVAQAAMDSGVATRPIDDMAAYKRNLQDFVYRSGIIMRPIFERTRNSKKSLVYAEGEEDRVLQAAQQVVDYEIARPVLIGDRETICSKVDALGLRLDASQYDIVDPKTCDAMDEYAARYHELMGRRGITPGAAEFVVRSQCTVLAALMLEMGHVDAMISGVIGGFERNLQIVLNIIERVEGVRQASTLMTHLLPDQTLFICDAHITPEPAEDELIEMTLLAAEEVRQFGIEPRIALVSHSNFGASQTEAARRMRAAVEALQEIDPDLAVDGEMQADAALSEKIRERLLPGSRLSGSANLLIMPNEDAANISMNLLKMTGKGVTIGPILMGMSRSAHIVAQSATVRSLVNMSAVAIEHALRSETE